MPRLSSPGILYKLRLHWKKSTAALVVASAGSYYGVDRYRAHCIRKSYCRKAKHFSDESLAHPTDECRRMMVFLNPAVDRGNPRKLYQKNIAPILHVAGIDVTLVESEYEGHLRTLMGYMDKRLSGIVIVGGDGSVQEAVTGLLRRSDEASIVQVPVGIVPMGKCNTFAAKLFKSESSQVKQQCEAAFTIVSGSTQSVDVMSFKPESAPQPIFSLGRLQWGLFRDTDRSLDSFWWSGRLRGFFAYLWPTMKSTWPTCKHISVTVPAEQPVSSPADASGATAANNSSSSCDSNAWLDKDISTTAIELCSPLVEDEQSDSVTLKVWPESLDKTSFIGYGWRKHVLRRPTEDLPVAYRLSGRDLRVNLPADEVSWFSIDGEMYEAQSIHVKLLPKKLSVFAPGR